MSLWRDYLTDEFRLKPERTPGRKPERRRGRRFQKWESRFEESQNYEVAESMEYKRHAVRDYVGAHVCGSGSSSSSSSGGGGSVSQRRACYRWALIFFIGLLCALCGVGIHMSTIFLVTFKNDIVTKYMYSVSREMMLYVVLCCVFVGSLLHA
jgi:hypothetical protein